MRRWILALFVIWPLMVLPGLVWLQDYAAAPGQLARPPDTWPVTLPLQREPGQATLVMLAHPRCPCTRASIAELARLMADIEGLAAGSVLFVDPGEGWDRTDLWTLAEAIPGVRALWDPGGELSHALGAYTSGQVLLYGADGALLFNGGITRARGHEGDNAGRTAITSILNRTGPAAATSAVFGCGLDEAARAR